MSRFLMFLGWLCIGFYFQYRGWNDLYDERKASGTALVSIGMACGLFGLVAFVHGWFLRG